MRQKYSKESAMQLVERLGYIFFSSKLHLKAYACNNPNKTQYTQQYCGVK